MRFPRPRLAVVKVGSSSLRASDGRLDRGQVEQLAHQLADARAAGTRTVLVSSGAVAAGIGRLGLGRRPADLPTLQAAAAIGQGDLIHEYQRHLAGHSVVGAQILLTQDDFVRRGRYLNARTTLHRLLELGCLPIVNENDAVATEELAYGDNDHLAALVASMLDADLLLLLSDVDGLHERDPRLHPGAPLRSRVEDVAAVDRSTVGGRGSFVGSGGMRTKLEAARVATSSGAHAVVANARRQDVVAEVLAGGDVGTWFVAGTRRQDARRLWIGFALTPRGRITIDAGAVAALVTGSSSLLAVGVTDADGTFVAGDAVEVVGPDGVAVARGIVSFDVADVRRLAGRSTGEAAAELGPAYAREVVHRDDLFVLRPTG